MHARYGAVRGAGLLRVEFAAYVGERVFFQRNRRIAALLRAVVHQTVLTNVEVARAGTTAPLIGTAQRDVVLEGIHPCEAALLKVLHLVIHAPLFVVQRLHLSRTIVNDSYS